NPHGLKADGKALALALIKRHVWVDLTHASDASLSELLPLLKNAGMPLLFTHTFLRDHLPAERALPPAVLPEIARSHGVLGLMPSEEHLGPRSRDARGACSLAEQIREIERELPASAIALGSDTNGGVEHLRPG